MQSCKYCEVKANICGAHPGVCCDHHEIIVAARYKEDVTKLVARLNENRATKNRSIIIWPAPETPKDNEFGEITP